MECYYFAETKNSAKITAWIILIHDPIRSWDDQLLKDEIYWDQFNSWIDLIAKRHRSLKIWSLFLK